MGKVLEAWKCSQLIEVCSNLVIFGQNHHDEVIIYVWDTILQQSVPILL